MTSLTRWSGLALCGLMVALSAAINFRFGQILGAQLGQLLLLPWASLAADGFKVISPVLVLALWSRRKLPAIAIAVLGFGCLVYSFAAALGVAGGALAQEGAAVASLSQALGLNAATSAVVLTMILVVLIEAGAAIGAIVVALKATEGAAQDEPAVVFSVAPERRAPTPPETPPSAPAAAPPPPLQPEPRAESEPAASSAAQAASLAPQDVMDAKPGIDTETETPGLDRTPEPAERDPEPEADQSRKSGARGGARGGWSLFKKKPRARPYGEGTAAPLDEPQLGKSEPEPAQEQTVGRHHGRALHSRVKDMTEKLEREARERREREAGDRSDRKDSA